MDTPRRRVVVLVLLFLGPVCLCWVDACARSGHVEAVPLARMRWVVKVTADPNIIPLDGRTVAALLCSDAVLSEAARSAQRAGPSTRVPSFECESLTGEPHRGPLGRAVVVALDVDLPGARKFAKDLVAGLRLDRAAARVNDLQQRLAILQPPRVIVLGAGD